MVWFSEDKLGNMEDDRWAGVVKEFCPGETKIFFFIYSADFLSVKIKCRLHGELRLLSIYISDRTRENLGECRVDEILRLLAVSRC